MYLLRQIRGLIPGRCGEIRHAATIGAICLLGLQLMVKIRSIKVTLMQIFSDGEQCLRIALATDTSDQCLQSKTLTHTHGKACEQAVRDAWQ
jgi:hypothetical protein